MNNNDLIPNGFSQINVQAAFVNRQTGELVLLGIPEDKHNCDAMGCGTLDHVVLRVTLPILIAAEQRNEAVSAGQTCPLCDGSGQLRTGLKLVQCWRCKGIGHV